MDPFHLPRRTFVQQAGLSLGAMAFGSLAARAAAQAQKPGLPALPHFPAKAKRVIFLTQSGGPSQIELFDHKPGLADLAGTELPESVRRGQRLTTMTSGQRQLIKPGATKFERCGKSGATIGEWLPHLRKVADDLCFIKSMHTDQINHAPAMTQFLTGNQIPGRPSMGRGRATASAAKTGTCLTTSSCSPACSDRATSPFTTTTGAAAFCPRVTKA